MSKGADEAAKQNGGKHDDRSKDRHLNPQQQRAFRKLQSEAKEKGATLESGGRGGLSPDRVLGILRRDEWRCKRCGKNQRLTIHHIGGIVSSKRTSELGHKNQANNFVTLDAPCHDALHEDARRKGIDSSQVTPEADKGTRRDHGLPDAKPKS